MTTVPPGHISAPQPQTQAQPTKLGTLSPHGWEWHHIATLLFRENSGADQDSLMRTSTDGGVTWLRHCHLRRRHQRRAWRYARCHPSLWQQPHRGLRVRDDGGKFSVTPSPALTMALPGVTVKPSMLLLDLTPRLLRSPTSGAPWLLVSRLMRMAVPVRLSRSWPAVMVVLLGRTSWPLSLPPATGLVCWLLTMTWASWVWLITLVPRPRRLLSPRSVSSRGWHFSYCLCIYAQICPSKSSIRLT